MLAADKLQLQSALKQQATALKEKEFNLHHSNLMTVGTQAAVLAGLDITMFIEFNPPDNGDWGEDMKLLPRTLKFFYYFTIVAAFCANMIVVSHTTTLSVLGAGLALRGPDGSMMTATDGLYEERRSVFYVFGVGLACTIVSVVIGVWIILSWEAAFLCWLLSLYTCRTIWIMFRRVQSRFEYDESETVDFRDIMEGPAAIQAVPMFGGMNNFSRMKNNNYKKASSLPVDVPLVAINNTSSSATNDPYSDRYDMEWQSSNQQFVDRSDRMTKRKGQRVASRSTSPSSTCSPTERSLNGVGNNSTYIQTI